MAGGKKAVKNLTPEEWLEQALVPAEEQPYAVPGNWCWTDIKSINHYSGSSVDSMKQPDKIFELYSVPSSANNYPEIVTGSEIGSTKQSVRKDDVLLCKINPRINRVWKVTQYTENELLASSEWIIVRNVAIDSDYLTYCFRAQYFRKYMMSNVSGVGGSLMRAQPKFVKNYPVPIAPLPEQRRIVALIERLFNKLDEAKEKAQAVVNGFELRRSAVLHKAFSGELTERWRKEHNMTLESWRRLSISSICNSLKYGTAKKSEKTGSVVVIRMGNLQRGEIDWSDLAYSNDPDDIEKYHLDAGDVLFNRTNSVALVGKTSIYRGEYPAIYAGYLIRLDYKHDIIIGEFLNYALNTNHAKEYCNSVKTDGVNQSNINAKKIGAYIIPVPTIDEQVKIVEYLQNLLKKEQQAQKAAESVLDQIDIIKKAILSRAFRGELGTNDPKEENAENLLLKMFKEKDNVEHKIKSAAKDKTDTKASHNFKNSLEETIYQFILNHPECTLSEMKSLSGNLSDINKVLLHLKQNKKVQISNSKYRVIIQDEDPISSIQ